MIGRGRALLTSGVGSELAPRRRAITISGCGVGAGRWIIREYRAEDVPDFEVAVFQTRDDAMRWYFSTNRERDGLPPLKGRLDWDDAFG